MRFGEIAAIPERLIQSPEPTIGVVIGTYGSVPYVALQMEVWKRYWPELPVLVHDDCSPDAERLRRICGDYGAEFQSTTVRGGHRGGDLAAITAGIEWAHDRGVELLVKVSRRFVIAHDFTPGLRELAFNTQYATYTNSCCDHLYPFRSECCAFHVRAWRDSPVMAEMRKGRQDDGEPAPPIEFWYHETARRVHLSSAPMAVRRREAAYPRSPGSDAYGMWQMLGHGRESRVPGVLWHGVNMPEDYWQLGRDLGQTNYTLHDFRMPNSRLSVEATAPRATPAAESDDAAPRRALDAEGGTPDAAARLTPLDINAARAALEQRRTTNTWIYRMIRKRAERRNGEMPWNTYRRLQPLIRRNASCIELLNCCGEPWLVDLQIPQSIPESLGIRSRLGINRFVWKRVELGQGALLAIGSPSALLIRGTDCPQQGQRPVIVAGPAGDYLNWLGAICSLNQSAAMQIWEATSGAGGGAWPGQIMTLSLPPIAVIVITHGQGFTETLRQIGPLIRRDRPELVFAFNTDAATWNADEMVELKAFLGDTLGYDLYAVIGDGTFSEFPPSTYRPSHAHAQPRERATL